MIAERVADPPLRWQVRRRPHRRYLAVAGLLAIVLGAAGGWLLRLLMIEPSSLAAVAMGLAIAGVCLATAARGASASVDARGVLRYGWGARQAIEVDLADVAEVRVVDAGLLRGVGLAVLPERVRFLSRKGPSPRRMRDDRARLGIDLVLEFLTPGDAADLDRLRAVPAASP